MRNELRQDLLVLTKTEMDILENGKMGSSPDGMDDPETQARLEKTGFYDVQDKYKYGFYLGRLPGAKSQLKEIMRFKKHIMRNAY